MIIRGTRLNTSILRDILYASEKGGTAYDTLH